MRRVVLIAALALPAMGCAHLVILNDPLTAAEHNDLGVVYEKRNESELARREYQCALRKDRHFAIARVNLGNLAAAQGRWAAAERYYRGALVDRPEDLDAMNNLAIALVRQSRRLDEAERLAQRAVAGAADDTTYRATLEEVRRAQPPRATK